MSITITSPSTWRRIIYLLPLIVAVAVLATYFTFYKKFLYCEDARPCSPYTATEILSGVSPPDQIKVAAYVARASWTLINGVHVLACVLAIVTASIVIYQALSEYKQSTRWMAVLIVIALAADISLFVALWTAAKDTYSPAQQLLRATVGQVVPWINKFNRFGDALSITGTFCLAVAACATLWHRDVKNELNEEHVVKRVRLLRPVLYVAAATLVIALFRLSATHAWGISYLPSDNEFGRAVGTLTTGIVRTMGIVFTLLIGGIYLPAALLLRMRLRQVAASKEDPEAWITSQGMNLSIPQFLPRVIALLSPLIAGPLGELVINATKSLGADV